MTSLTGADQRPSKFDVTTRWVSSLILISVGLSAAALSWRGLQDLGENIGYGNLAILFPWVIDGVWVASSLQIIRAAREQHRAVAAWSGVWVGIVVSVVGNASTSTSNHDRFWHSIPPLAAAFCLEMLVSSLRRRVVDEHAEAQQRAEEAAAEADRLAREEAAQQRAERRATQEASKPSKPRQTPSQPASRPRSAGIDLAVAADVYVQVEAGRSYREIEESGLCKRSAIKRHLDAHRAAQTITTETEEAA